MHRILFLCHGNICRSPMAEYIFKDLVRKAGREAEFEIASAAVSNEETGNPIYPPALALLRQKGIPAGNHRAHRITPEEFRYYDLILIMDRSNHDRLMRLIGPEAVRASGKVHWMMEYAGEQRDVADPWYTRDFETTWRDLDSACRGLLETF